MGDITKKNFEKLFQASGKESKYSFFKLIGLDGGTGRKYFKGSQNISLETLNELSEKADLEMNITFDKKEKNNNKIQNNEKHE